MGQQVHRSFLDKNICRRYMKNRHLLMVLKLSHRFEELELA